MDLLGRARRSTGDPFTRSIVVSVVLIAAGFVAIGLGWRGAARSLIVAEQLPFLLSGGIGGLALIVAGSATLALQSSRYWNARERRQIDRLVRRASEVRSEDQARGEPASMSRVNAPPK
jgi:hypothetical protein